MLESHREIIDHGASFLIGERDILKRQHRFAGCVIFVGYHTILVY